MGALNQEMGWVLAIYLSFKYQPIWFFTPYIGLSWFLHISLRARLFSLSCNINLANFSIFYYKNNFYIIFYGYTFMPKQKTQKQSKFLFCYLKFFFLFKILTVKKFPVRPTGLDINENILSEEVRYMRRCPPPLTPSLFCLLIWTPKKNILNFFLSHWI